MAPAAELSTAFRLWLWSGWSPNGPPEMCIDVNAMRAFFIDSFVVEEYLEATNTSPQSFP
jgi:hypothetical protein